MKSVFKHLVLRLALACLVCSFSAALAQDTGNETDMLLTMGTAPVFPVVPQPSQPKQGAGIALLDAWIPVPDWLAGTWQANAQLILYSYNHLKNRYTVDQPLSVPIDRRSQIGMQKDWHGQIWHYTGTPYVREIATENYIERQNMERMKVLQSSQDKLVLWSLANVAHIDKSTGEVVDTFKEQTTTTYELLRDGSIQSTYMVNDYNQVGTPRTSSRSLCFETRIKPYHQVDYDHRGNLRQMFEQFMDAQQRIRNMKITR